MMANLFSPLTIGGMQVPNRIVMAPAPSGLAAPDGFVQPELTSYYTRRARGGVGLVLSESLHVTPPDGDDAPHLGAYDDAFVPGLHRLATSLQGHGTRILFTLDAPPPQAQPSARELKSLAEAFMVGAWRAQAAGADGVLLNAADGGLLYSLLSPLHNRRADSYGPDLAGRLRLLLEIVEGVRRWIGPRMLVGCRLLADEFTPGGMSLQDARVAAKRLTAAGVRLLDITAPMAVAQVAHFPGWAIPLANSIRRVIDVPVIGSGLLGDPQLADSIIRDGSVDLVMLDQALRNDPDWPQAARQALLVAPNA
jgi:NADPH2 dehydrogenase